jgi:drug/metabolite transporter (DMT)-like permease
VAAVTVLVLGLNWPVMTFGVATIPPLWLTSMRLLGAGAGIAVILWLRGDLRPPPRADLPVVGSVAIVRLALVFGLVTSALLFVSPGRASLLTHTAALWAAPLGAWFLDERLTRTKAIALLVGIAGIALLMEPWTLRITDRATIGYAMLVTAAIATAASTVHMRGHRWASSPIALMPWQLLIAGCLSAVAAMTVAGAPRLAWDLREIGVVAYQVVLAGGVGVWGTITISRALPATSTGIVMMAVPVIGVASSVLAVGEVLTPATLAGMGVVLTAVAASVLADRRASTAVSAAAA